MKTVALFLVVAGAMTNAFATLSLWWWAAFHNWQGTVVFDRYGEHWAEGIMFHAFGLMTAWAVWRYWGKPKAVIEDLTRHG